MKGTGAWEERGAPSQSFKVQKEETSKVPTTPLNPIVPPYLWGIHPKKSLWLYQAWPGQTPRNSTIPPFLPMPLKWPSTHWGGSFLPWGMRQSPHILILVMSSGKEGDRTWRHGQEEASFKHPWALNPDLQSREEEGPPT